MPSHGSSVNSVCGSSTVPLDVVQLTPAGKAFLGPARRVLAEVSNSRAAAEAVVGVLSGELRIMGVRTATIETAHLVVEFHRLHPGIHLLIEEPTGDQGVIDAIHSGRCDIGVIHSTEKPTDLLACDRRLARISSQSSRNPWPREPEQ